MVSPSCRFAVLFVAMCLTSRPEIMLAQGLPTEPVEEFLVNEDVNIATGLYTREYSLHNDGVIDYRTARQIIDSRQNDYGNTVVEATPHPLFYWYDEKRNGAFTMWIDPEGQGCPCDIVPYVALAGEAGESDMDRSGGPHREYDINPTNPSLSAYAEGTFW
jgi:hypothetical protein